MVDRMVEMGYPAEVATIALQRNNQDVLSAVDYLISHPEVQTDFVARREREMLERVEKERKVARTNPKKYDFPERLMRNKTPQPLAIPGDDDGGSPHTSPHLSGRNRTMDLYTPPSLESEFSDNEDDYGDFDCDYVSDGIWSDEIASMPMDTNVLATSDIRSSHEEDIKSIMEVCSVNHSIAAALLRHYKFNKEELVQAFYTGDQAQILEEAGIVDSKTRTVTRQTNKQCGVCLEVKEQVLGLSCGHSACMECWENYLSVRIKEKNVKRMECFGYDCHIVVSDEILEEIVGPEMYERYEQVLSERYVEENAYMVWCPSPNCSNAVDIRNAQGATVVCSCGHKFCYKCAEEAHDPATCDDLRKWKKKCKDESETYNWISVHAKECPECHAYIEKDGGCNHMICKKCKSEFCWVCMKAWKGHVSFYECNKFKEEPSADDELVSSKKALEKYLHYYHRYVNHQDSLKKERELREKTKEKMKLLQTSDASWVDVQFIMKAEEQLTECRETLKWTYVFAYYLQEGKEKELFEFLQQELESTTEKLSGLLEGTITKENRIIIIDTTRLGSAKLENLLKGVENGLTNM